MNKKVTQIISKLYKKKINFSIAESCTGGMLSQTITSIKGASKVFTYGIITYSNRSKIKYLKVPYRVIKKYGSVSEQCCYSMVVNLEKISKAKLNLAITGIAGPSGGTALKPVGLVYIGIKKNKKIKICKFIFKNQSREIVRKKSVKEALTLIEEFI
jgi:nicotinamide-nucleotide amidase|tara:strand:+ start:218 stop:688 length:471 start_codon:yes stop_codon:yes gene_type:complete